MLFIFFFSQLLQPLHITPSRHREYLLIVMFMLTLPSSSPCLSRQHSLWLIGHGLPIWICFPNTNSFVIHSNCFELSLGKSESSASSFMQFILFLPWTNYFLFLYLSCLTINSFTEHIPNVFLNGKWYICLWYKDCRSGWRHLKVHFRSVV